jgi:FkbM family methyltransferase
MSFFGKVRLKCLLMANRMVMPIRRRDDLLQLGGAGGGWVIPARLLSRSSTCYCVGVGEDITFDLALIERFGCQVFAFDPTPRAIAHVRKHAREVPNFHFHDLGVWEKDAELKFFAPRNAAHVSHSVVNLQHTTDFFTARCKRLSTIMRELGHAKIDLLKLDIEGAEYEVVQSLIDDRIFPAIVCVEFDQPMPYRRTLRAVGALRDVGYELSSVEGWNFTFSRAEPS